ncbi:hypothetical protein [Saccharothrix xinjiangensis]|uniref:Uncharacterized protein n=1 Tax=Saccharothrix xinjiangensis TaxID=204798 RepID=A0ABV9YC66_9PSEU
MNSAQKAPEKKSAWKIFTVVAITATTPMLSGSGQAGAVAPTCGTTLESWTGPDDTAVYNGRLRQGWGDPAFHTIALVKGKATDRVTGQNGKFYFQLKGDYSASDVKENVLQFWVTDPQGEELKNELEFSRPVCDDSGNVTSAGLSFAAGKHLGQVDRVH